MKKIIFSLILLFPLAINAVSTSASKAILMDMDSNRIIYAKNIHTPQSVASISKIMTAIVAIESGKLDDEITINNSISKAYGSAIYIKEGEKIYLRDLVYGLMLRSGNDAALAIADYVGGDVNNFVKNMNEKAEKIGMKNTTFNNPSGLDEKDGNFSTAYDMAILTSYAMKNKEYRKIVSTQKYKVSTNKNNYLWKNKNKLLKIYKYATGGKTGYTKKAKRTLVTTASNKNINLVAVTLNDGNDFKDHMNLFEYAFNTYDKCRILKSGKINIYNEKYYKNYILYIKEDFDYILDNSEKEIINLKYNIYKQSKIKSGREIGNIEIKIGDKVIHKEKIYIRKKTKKKWHLW